MIKSSGIYEKLINLDKETLARILAEGALQHDDIRQAIETVLIPADKATEPEQPIIQIPGSGSNSSYESTSVKVTHFSSAQEKIALYRSLFRGRTDVYAFRWQNSKTGKSGYSPVCRNKWIEGKCNMKQVACAACPYREPAVLDDSTVFNHLLGNDPLYRDVIGLYPLLSGNSCFFLAMDFDEKSWRTDCLHVRSVCTQQAIPLSVEISRSGNGAHLWFFFSEPLAAAKIRQFAFSLLQYTMSEYHELPFSSFDRVFPNQDTMPKGGYGNLIALPLQGRAVKQGHSVFVDGQFIPYPDQWEYLSSCVKITEKQLDAYLREINKDVLSFSSALQQPTDIFPDRQKTRFFIPAKYISPSSNTGNQLLLSTDFSKSVLINLSNAVRLTKDGISERALGMLKRLAVFQNPEFYQAEKLRLPTWNKPRYIDCSEETETQLCLPRGCLEAAIRLIKSTDASITITDERQKGIPVHVTFTGELKPDQQEALDSLFAFDNGVLSAGTGFGKTVTAAALIARRNVNTLILVHTHTLLSQWKKALKKFLSYDAGSVGGGKEKLSGEIDIAVMQSLFETPDITAGSLPVTDKMSVKPVVQKYGMILVDECHHISAFSFERILKTAAAKYVYGLTATPFRRDGHQPIIFMQCGPVRYTADVKKQARELGFARHLIPRFSPFQPFVPEAASMTLAGYYKAVCENEERNTLILTDIEHAVTEGRTPLVLSERVSHITGLAEKLKQDGRNVILITGQGTAKEKKQTLEALSAVPETVPLVVLATGRYAGEGFDSPRLDTLFLTMPVSWKGTVTQYCGRLHRPFKNKTEVQIYDYVDFRIPPFEHMYQKRLKEYAALGYTLMPENNTTGSGLRPVGTGKTLFTGTAYQKDFADDLECARKQIFISSPYPAKRETAKFIEIIRHLITRGIKIFVLLRLQDESQQAEAQDDQKKKIRLRTQAVVQMLQEAGVKVKCRADIVQRCAIIDSAEVWYGSADLLGYTASDDCVIHFKDTAVAAELESEWEKGK